MKQRLFVLCIGKIFVAKNKIRLTKILTFPQIYSIIYVQKINKEKR